jgi:hypothetical protein
MGLRGCGGIIHHSIRKNIICTTASNGNKFSKSSSMNLRATINLPHIIAKKGGI